MQKYGDIKEDEKHQLKEIFTDVEDDAEWHQESTMFEHYKKRIPV